LVNIIGKINSVANTEGKGRDDLKVDILIAAEGMSRRSTSVKSNAVNKLAREIIESYKEIRLLFQRYEQNIEAVDP